MTDPVAPDTPYISADDIRASVTGLSARLPDDSDYKIPDSTLERFLTRWENLVEAEVGFPLTPRTRTLTVAAGRGPILLPVMHVSEITAITYDVGTAPAVGDLVIVDGYEVWPGPIVDPACSRHAAVWPAGRLVTFDIVYGLPSPPATAVDGGIEFVRSEALQQAGSQPRNVTGERTDLGWIPEPTADRSKGRLTRWTVCNEAIDQLREIYGGRMPSFG